MLSPNPLSNFCEKPVKKCISSRGGERRNFFAGWNSDKEDGVLDLDEVDREMEGEESER